MTKKVVLIGDTGVGKTSIALSFTNDSFSESCPETIGVDFMTKALEGKDIRLQLWDTSGQERFKSIISSYFRDASAMIIVYDITKRSSYDHVKQHLEHALEHLGENAIFTLVGNKLDQSGKREVPEEEVRLYAEENGLNFIEVSAKDKTNIDELFDLCLKNPSSSADEESADELNDTVKAKVGALRDYANILRNLSQEKWSKNDAKAASSKALSLDQLIPQDNVTQKTIEDILRNNSEGLLDNRSKLRTPIFYKIHSFFTGKVNPFKGDGGRYCESKTEELLVDLYNSF